MGCRWPGPSRPPGCTIRACPIRSRWKATDFPTRRSTASGPWDTRYRAGATGATWKGSSGPDAAGKGSATHATAGVARGTEPGPSGPALMRRRPARAPARAGRVVVGARPRASPLSAGGGQRPIELELDLGARWKDDVAVLGLDGTLGADR